jgi:hypothetical protein
MLGDHGQRFASLRARVTTQHSEGPYHHLLLVLWLSRKVHRGPRTLAWLRWHGLVMPEVWEELSRAEDGDADTRPEQLYAFQ